MYKKKPSEKDNQCPICDGIIWGKGQKVLIEGAKITVCQSCAQYGKRIITKTKSNFIKRSYNNKTITSKRGLASKTKNFPESSIEIVPDYAKRIKDVRTFNKLNQDQFAQKLNEKPSLIRRIESGKVTPTEKLAKKIEKVYNIKLMKKADEFDVNTKKYMKKQTNSSLADVAHIKRKKK